MRFFHIFQLLALVHYACSLWIPEGTPKELKGRGVRVPLIHNRAHDAKAQLRSKRSLEIRGGNMGSGQAVLTTAGRYLFPLTIGDQSFMMDFDTGSGDLWVLSSQTAISGYNYYVPSKSSVPLHQPFIINYGDGSEATGTTYSDTINLGGIVIEAQAVEVATFTNGTLIQNPVDGVLGMNLLPLQTSGFPSVLSNLINDDLESRLFTCSVTRPEESVEGFCTIGYIPSPLTPSDIRFANVTSNKLGYWMFPSTTAKIGNELYQRPSGNTAIADTGTTTIHVDDGLLEALYGPLNGFTDSNGIWYYPASSQHLVPTIILPMDGFDVTLQPEDLPIEDDNGYYIGALQSRGQNTFDTFRDYWLTKVYAVFDLTENTPRFGVALR